MNKQTNTALKQVIVRISPVSHSPILFDVESKNDNQITCIVNGEDRVVDLAFYAASIPMEDFEARAVVQAYAERANIPLESLLLRQRLPKTNMKTVKQPRKTNDSNLVLAHDSSKGKGKQESQQDYRSKQEKESGLAQLAQQLHDNETKPEQKASAEIDNSVRAKRKYDRAPKAQRTARSKAAYERYVKEIGKAVESVPAPVEMSPTATKEVFDDATLELAMKLAVILRKNPGLF